MRLRVPQQVHVLNVQGRVKLELLADFSLSSRRVQGVAVLER